MRDEVKKSLNIVFEHEKLHERRVQSMKAKQKNRFIPIITGLAVLLAITLIVVPIIGWPSTSINSSSDRTTLDEYKGEFIGNNSAMSNITKTIFYEYELDGIALQTKKEPYGITVNTKEAIPEHLRLKYALYVFSLIENASYVEINQQNTTYIIDRLTLEQTHHIEFAVIEGDDNIMSTYYKLLAKSLPQIQSSREDAYKYLFTARKSNTIVTDWQTTNAPEFSFKLDDQQYIAWEERNEDLPSYYIVETNNPSQAKIVSGKAYEQLAQFVSSDYELVTGTIAEITDNQLLITIDHNEAASYLVTVDNGSDFKVGETVTAWATMTTKSIPEQAHATKIQRK